MSPIPVRDRLVPYKILAYLLYTKDKEWIESLGEGKLRLYTGPAARFFRLRSVTLWKQLNWLAQAGLLEVQREKVKGLATITLKKVER